MPADIPEVRLPPRGAVWKWWVCGLLLLATMINYMDRLTVNLTAERIIREFDLSKTQYGLIESVFAIAFAFGALGAGWMADRYNVRWLYPAAVLLWSVAGFATGFARSLVELMLFRFMLGLFESGNWPCALRTTQRILPPQERTMGNSILQSGASLGAVVTPLIVLAFLQFTTSWRPPFLAIGAIGALWVVLWMVSVRSSDLALPKWDGPPPAAGEADLRATPQTMWSVYKDRRFLICVLMVVTINCTWHFFRVWLPLFLRETHGYSEKEINWFAAAYYLFADAGTLLAGFLTLWLARRGLAVHRSRVLVFFGFALLTTVSAVAAFLPTGPVLLALLLLTGFGSLGVFPNYYSFTQEMTVRHQGKVSGSLGFIAWMSMALLQYLSGLSIDATRSYTLGVAMAGFLPLLAWVGLVLFWKAGDDPNKPLPLPPEDPVPIADEAIRGADDSALRK